MQHRGPCLVSRIRKQGEGGLALCALRSFVSRATLPMLQNSFENRLPFLRYTRFPTHTCIRPLCSIST